MKSAIVAFVFACSTLAIGDAAALAVYKLTDKDGKVTYTQLPPRNFDGLVSRLDIDPDAHAVALPNPPRADPSRRDLAERVIRPPSISSSEALLERARQRVEAAQRALEDAQNGAGPEDYIYFGPNNPLGMRRAPKPEYMARIAQLEQNLNAAEEELKTAERR